MPQSLIDLAGLRVGPEEFLAAVLGATEQPIWVVDPEGVIRFANPAAISALGYDRVDELLGRHSHETIHHSHPDGTPYPAADCPMLLPRATGETVSSDLDWFFRRDGSKFPVSYVSAPIEMHDGRGAVVAFTDIGDRVRAEQRLREHDAALAAQQASLRRVATLVEGGAKSEDVFAAIAREVGGVTGLPLVAVWRYEPDDTATVVGAWSDHPHPFQPGTRWPLDGPTITSQVIKTRRPVRIDDWAQRPGTIADAARKAGITAAAGVPIVVEGEVWGAMSVDSTDGAPMPDDVEDRLLEFTELVAAAFATTARQEELARLADEQAALRRVATLVAQGVPPRELFAVVTEEVGRRLEADAAATIRYEPEGVVTAMGSWSAEGVEADTEVGRQWPLAGESLAPRILKTGQPARIDDWKDVPGPIAEYARTRLGLSCSVGAPIVVEGRVWGNIAVHSTSGQLAPDTEARIARFTELVSTAILNAEARAEVERLADEQAALRRVATMVAREREAPEVFAAVAEEVGRLLPVEDAAMMRYEDDGSAMIVASWGVLAGVVARGTRLPVDGDNITARVLRTGQPARMDDYATASGAFGARMRELGIGAAVGCPVVVDGQLWGAMVAAQGEHGSLPADTEARVAQFTELIATAISNLQARAEVARLAEEHAALRRVATLVAHERPPAQVFAAVAEETGRLLGVEDTTIFRYEDDLTATVVADRGEREVPMPVGSTVSLEGDSATALVRRTGRAARVDDFSGATGPLADYTRNAGIGSTVGSPIVVEGRLWGAMITATRTNEPMPPETESRLTQFTELMATAIANTESHAEVERLADEQAALRRVATLVAEGASPSSVLDAVAAEMEALLEADQVALNRFEAGDEVVVLAHRGLDVARTPVGSRVGIEGESATALVRRTGRPARMEGYESAGGALAELARVTGLRSSVSAPISVEGELWGVITASWKVQESPPPDTEERMEKFTALVATAIANAESREAIGQLAGEQAALRRVATLIAEAVPPRELFDAVVEELGTLLRTDLGGMIRYEADGTVTAAATWAAEGEHPPVEGRWSLEGDRLATTIARTRRPTREDDWEDLEGPIAEFVRTVLGVRSSVGSPIIVEGEVWGALFVHSKQAQRPLPPDTEERITNFAELVATAISNAQARAEVGRLAEEQAALRRVATLVAEDVPASELFHAVAREVGTLLDVDFAGMARFEDGDVLTVSAWAAVGEFPSFPDRWEMQPGDPATTIADASRAARWDDWSDEAGPIAAFIRDELGVSSTVGCPIIVAGRTWGALAVHSKQPGPLPPDTEARVGQFTELVGTSIANAETRAEVARLAREQAALRRVATLVAEERPASEVFAGVAEEVGRALHLEDTRIVRFGAGGNATVVASWGQLASALPVGARVSLEGVSAVGLVFRTGRPSRIDDFTTATGPFAASLQELGVQSGVAAPIVVEGRLWGALNTASLRPDPIPADIEARMGQFTELVATAISNIEARAELAASRARIVEAADDERRRVVRDLHDGAQQRLVHTVITLKLAGRAFKQGDDGAPLLAEALDQAERATAELRELSHGVLPAVLARGGLRAGVEALASRTPVPVDINVSTGRLPATIEATGYFVVAEALTNVAKHSRATRAEVTALVDDGTLRVRVSDDGIGGAQPDGPGLLGLADRAAALDGRLRVGSPEGGGTLIAADIPLPK
jgi:PAS domain S-box-containing protein